MSSSPSAVVGRFVAPPKPVAVDEEGKVDMPNVGSSPEAGSGVSVMYSGSIIC